jgi:hypothetical protein
VLDCEGHHENNENTGMNFKEYVPFNWRLCMNLSCLRRRSAHKAATDYEEKK